MRGSRRLTTIIGTLAFGLIGGVAQATLLTFEGNICGGGPCGNGAPIDQSYGDAAGMVDVTYTDRVSGGASAPVEPFLRYWANDYNDLQNVAYGGSPGGVAEIRLTPAGGFQVTLNSFDLGAWPDATRPSQYTIYDSSYSVLYSSGAILVGSGATTHSHFTPGLTNSGGLILQWGPDSYNVGIDNLDFTVAQTNTNPIPEPATAILLGSGLLALARGRRRR